jgi:dipeptidyl aminopeptidase/acylaminoacyl peptidase
MKSLFCVAVVLMAAVSGGLSQAQAQDPLSLGDIMQLEWASDPQISPDGQSIAYVRNGMDPMSDSRRGSLWMIDVASGEQRPLTRSNGNFRSPRFSPDGKRLAYVASEGQGAQIFVRWLDSGQVAQVTRLRQAPRGITWSRDGSQIAFIKFVKLTKEPMVSLPGKPSGAKWAPPAEVIDRVLYRADGRGYLPYGFDHLFVVPAEGGTARQLTQGAHHYSPSLAWAGDDESIFVVGNRRDDWDRQLLNTDIYQVTLADKVVTAITDRYGPDQSPVLSPDGRWLAYVGFDDQELGYQNMNLYVRDLRAGETTQVQTGLDRSVSPVAWGSGRRLFIAYEDRGESHIAVVDRNGKVTDRVADLGGGSLGRPYGQGSFSVSNGGAIAYMRTTVHQPAEVALLRAGEPRQLTQLNSDSLGHRTLGSVEALQWVSSAPDAQKIDGWLVKPPDYEPTQTYPLILEIHGGPFANYGPRFSMEAQLYAAAGYLVLYANPRGSTSYGEAFGNLIHHNYPGEDFNDLMSGVDTLIEQEIADPERLYVTGGSGGGVLTAWIIGKTNRFKAAVVAKPVINWISFTLTADAYPFFYRYWFPDTPWNIPEHYFARSPLSLVGQVETPAMIITGERDYRTPISESEQYYQALKLRDLDTVLVRLPGASHGITSRPSQMMSKVAHALAWFERYGGPSP